MRTIRISVPDTARKDEIIELKAMIKHDMETGYRVDINGKSIPRMILTYFECRLDDDVIFSADLHPGVSANPILKFHMRAIRSGTLTFEWTEQSGQIFSKTAELNLV